MYRMAGEQVGSIRHKAPVPQRWELWWAYTLFYDTSDVKLRPVIILESKRDMVPVIELTTHEPRTWLVWQYPLMDWQQAGLRRPSTAVLGAVTTVPKEAFGRRIGQLSHTDQLNIECMLEMQINEMKPGSGDVSPHKINDMQPQQSTNRIQQNRSTAAGTAAPRTNNGYGTAARPPVRYTAPDARVQVRPDRRPVYDRTRQRY